MFYFLDSTFLLLIPPLLLAGYAQYKVRRNIRRYQKIGVQNGVSGAQAARSILNQYGLHDVQVGVAQGYLGDHYDPRSKAVNLSPENYNGSSVAAVAIAAHECGHALQDKEAYAPLSFRTRILPVANLGSWAAFPLFIAGFIFTSTTFINLGIMFFAAAVIFQLVTLPVEFNASSRALQIIRNDGYVNQVELSGAKKVLNAAALTYVASALMALMELLRLVLISSAMDD
jgi:Zn-dependent membrane protease YugP